jgi:hypothetical protein
MKTKTLMEQIIKNVDRKLITEEEYGDKFKMKIMKFESKIDHACLKISDKLKSPKLSDNDRLKLENVLKDLKGLKKIKDMNVLSAKFKVLKKDMVLAKDVAFKWKLSAAIIAPVVAAAGTFAFIKQGEVNYEAGQRDMARYFAQKSDREAREILNTTTKLLKVFGF